MTASRQGAVAGACGQCGNAAYIDYFRRAPKCEICRELLCDDCYRAHVHKCVCCGKDVSHDDLGHCSECYEPVCCDCEEMHVCRLRDRIPVWLIRKLIDVIGWTLKGSFFWLAFFVIAKFGTWLVHVIDDSKHVITFDEYVSSSLAVVENLAALLVASPVLIFDFVGSQWFQAAILVLLAIIAFQLHSLTKQLRRLNRSDQPQRKDNPSQEEADDELTDDLDT